MGSESVSVDEDSTILKTSSPTGSCGDPGCFCQWEEGVQARLPENSSDNVVVFFYCF